MQCRGTELMFHCLFVFPLCVAGAYNDHQTIGTNAPKVSMHKKLGDYTYASSTNPPFLAQR